MRARLLDRVRRLARSGTDAVRRQLLRRTRPATTGSLVLGTAVAHDLGLGLVHDQLLRCALGLGAIAEAENNSISRWVVRPQGFEPRTCGSSVTRDESQDAWPS